MKPLHLPLIKHGRILGTRQAGREVAEKIRHRLGDGRALVLDFAGVEAATPPFLQEILAAARSVITSDNSAHLVVVTNLNTDLKETLQFVLEREKMSLAELNGKRLDLLSSVPQLIETLKAAERLGEFTARELADELNLKTPNANSRLNNLVEAGAIARWRDPEAQHGKRYRYRAPDPETLAGAVR